MPKFGRASHEHLCSCDPELQDLFIEVVKDFDCSILQGYRTEKEQNELFKEGKTQLLYPNSNHNHLPSRAVDVAPYPIDWHDTDRFYYFAGYVMGIAKKRGLWLRFGGDWDEDKELKDNNFDDLVHFELKP